MNGIQEVMGSNPTISIYDKPSVGTAFFFRRKVCPMDENSSEQVLKAVLGDSKRYALEKEERNNPEWSANFFGFEIKNS